MPGRWLPRHPTARRLCAIALVAWGAGAQEAARPAPPQIILPAEKADGLREHWNQRREYLRERDERRAEDEEGRVRALKEDLAIENAFSIGAALVRESQRQLADRVAGSPALAKKRCQLAVELAPALPAAHACLGRATLAESITAIVPAAQHYLEAVKAGWTDPRPRRSFLANAGGVGLLGVMAAGGLLVLLFFLRYARLYLHDVQHIFPAGARSWQTTLVAAGLVLSPLLLQMGPLPILFTSAVAAALYMTTVETVAAAVVLALFAASPWAVEGLARVAAFGGPAADIYVIERGEGPPAAVLRLEKRLDSGKAEPAVPFVLARRAKRQGDFPLAEQLYTRALPGASGSGFLAATHNNLGNVALLRGDTAKATKHYAHAVELQETLAAAHFNLARAHSLGGVESLDRVQAEQARALELDRAAIEAFTGGGLQVNRRSNRIVMDVPLPESALEPLRDAEERAASPVGDDLRALMGGRLPGSAAPFLPLAAAALVVVLHLARARLRPSGQCERCGREVCKRCDSDARPNEALCAQCVNVFVRKGNVDATERIKKEIQVHRYQRRRKLVARVLGVFSGASHVLLGYPLQGAVFLIMTGLLVASVVLWRGVAHGPFPVRPGVSLLRIAITAAAFIAVYAVCLRDLIARQRAEGL